MGLDAIDIVLRTEEVFDICIRDSEVGEIVTVGQLFELVCTKLNLSTGTATPEHPGNRRLRPRLSITPQLAPWSREDVWATLVAIFTDQQGLDPETIRYHARLVQDLGID